MIFFHRSLQKFVYLACVFTFIYTIENAYAGFPIYEDMSIPKPEGLPYLSSSDFKVDPTRFDLYPKGFLYGNSQMLSKLCSFLQNGKDGIQLWEKATAETVVILNQWDFNEANFNSYVYRLPQLEDLALVYLFTGHKKLGQFINGHVFQITKLPYEFWLHAELRGFDPSFSKGSLEAAAICSALTLSLSAEEDLFTEEEKTKITSVLREKEI